MANRRMGGLILFFLIGVVTVYVFYGGSPSLTLDFGEGSFTASVADYDYTVPYDQVESLTLTDYPSAGTPANGDENRNARWGRWENEAWGSYTQCTAKKPGTCVVFTLKSGETFVLSLESDTTTAELHRMVTELLNSKGYTVS